MNLNTSAQESCEDVISMWIDDPGSFSFAPLPCLATDYRSGMTDNDINCLSTNLWGDSKN